MVDVENRRKAILVLKSRVPPVVQMFALAQDWFMVFPALVRLVIFTAEHVYSGNPGDRFSAQGVISHNKLVFHNWYKAVWVYMKHGVYSKQYWLAKRADKMGYYLVFMPYVGCFSSNSIVSTWIVSYLLVYTWHTPLHYPHAANAGCVLAGVAPVVLCISYKDGVQCCIDQHMTTDCSRDCPPSHRVTDSVLGKGHLEKLLETRARHQMT